MIKTTKEYFKLWDSRKDKNSKKQLKIEEIPLEVCREVCSLEPSTKLYLISNIKTPLEFLYDLCSDPDPKVRLAILSKRECPSDIVMKYASDPDSRIRYYVSRRSKAPIAIVRALCLDPDESVKKSAVRNLKLRSEKAQFKSQRDRTFYNAEEFLKTWDVDSRESRNKIKNAIIPLEVCREILGRRPESKFGLILNRNLPKEILFDLSVDSCEEIRYRIVTRNSCPTEILNRYIKDPSFRIRNNVCHHINVSIKTLLLLTKDENKSIRLTARRCLQSKGVDVEDIYREKLSVKSQYLQKTENQISTIKIEMPDSFIRFWSSKDEKERKKILKHEQISIQDCKELISLYPETKLTIAANKNTPIEFLYDLCDDPDYRVRLSVLNRRNCPLDIIEKYAQDPHNRVRYYVASRRNTSLKSLLILRNDWVKEVREAAKSNLKHREQMLQIQKEKEDARTIASADEYLTLWNAEYDSKDHLEVGRRLNQSIIPLEICREVIRREPNTKTTLLWNKQVPLELLYDLCDDPDEKVREGVVGKSKCPIDIIRKYARDPSDSIRYWVAGGPNTPIDVLIEMTKDKEVFIRKRAQKNLTYRQSLL